MQLLQLKWAFSNRDDLDMIKVFHASSRSSCQLNRTLEPSVAAMTIPRDGLTCGTVSIYDNVLTPSWQLTCDTAQKLTTCFSLLVFLLSYWQIEGTVFWRGGGLNWESEELEYPPNKVRRGSSVDGPPETADRQSHIFYTFLPLRNPSLLLL
ncbi:uncharacterized protein EI90DRAFT_3061042, partial [Cantharellus anzutake]|uniref:uncharacterized protein n=1 Tax=Cantharellus anzutake TaxID=1750568 RepID=UPI001904AB1D